MSEKNVFRSKEEELQRLTQEIVEIKASIREISAAVVRIERHVRRSFGVPRKAGDKTASPVVKEKKKQSRDKPTISPKRALSIFDELSSSPNPINSQEAESRLQKMTVPDLKLVAQELGVTVATRPSKRALCSGIIGRLKERAMLSKNINASRSQKEQMQMDKGKNDNS